MKNLNYIFLLLIAVSCRAQSPVINLRDWKGENIINSYLKDANNDLNAFEGTYVYTSGDTIFKIILKKFIMARTFRHYEDMLIGELEYKIGTTTLLNTLSQLNTVYFDQSRHLIDGSTVLQNHEVPDCSDCVPNEIRVRLSINDTRYVSAFFVKRTTVNGSPALKVFKQTFGPRTKLSGTTEPEPIIRDGNYIFIKQP
jgi:hypothetical protein